MATRKKAPAKKQAPKKKPAAKKKAAPKKKPTAASDKPALGLSIQRDAPRPMGRPPIKITPTHLEMVRTLAYQGCSKKNIAAMLGMSETTYYEKQIEYPELSEQFDLGKQQGITAVVGAMFSGALLGDFQKQRYILNNQDPENWQEKRTIEAGENLGKSLSSMRPEDRLELLNREQASAGA